MPQPKAGPLCFNCKTEPRVPRYTYCRGCKRKRDNAWRHANPNWRTNLTQSRNGNSERCNCGDRRCDGLRCDSLRYGTALYARAPIAHAEKLSAHQSCV